VDPVNRKGVLAVSKTVNVTTFATLPSQNSLGFNFVLCPGCTTWGANNKFDLNATLGFFTTAWSTTRPDNVTNPHSNITFAFDDMDHLFAANISTLKTAAATGTCPFSTVG
jgi:hypothetical protein